MLATTALGVAMAAALAAACAFGAPSSPGAHPCARGGQPCAVEPMRSDTRAAALVARSAWEPRPSNRLANQRIPSRRELARFRRSSRLPDALERRITGAFRGTTDEIVQWAALKWGLDPDLVRAQAVQESWWRQRGRPGDRGRSFGLMQIKRTTWRGTHPLSARSTAFNLDFYGAIIRYYHDGWARWLRRRAGRATGYRRGDLWGSVGAWYSGDWHDGASRRYVAAVRGRLAARTWSRPGF